MRKRLSPLIILLTISSILIGCTNNKSTQKTGNSQNEVTRKMENTKTSKTEIINYQTNYQGKNYEKRALVYLPKNYQAKQKHNILYLLHGSTEVNNGLSRLYSEGNFKQILDRLNDEGKLINTIVVFPTYYPSARQISSDYYDDNPLNRRFARKELVDDLIPVVEKRYHTYAENTSKEELIKTRDHRAFGGFSMGSITTWYVLQYDLPYFKYFVPMAGDSWTVTSDGGSTEPKRTAKVLAAEVKKYPNDKFKIFAGVGAEDGTRYSMSPQIKAMKALPQFNSSNLQYYLQAGGNHDAPTMGRIINHYGNQLFR